MKEATAVATKPVAVTVKIRLREGVDKPFSAWHAKMCTATSELPGFICAEVTAPAASGPPEWRIVQRFRSDDKLQGWLQSAEHRQLMLEAESLVEKTMAGGLLEQQGHDNPEEAEVTEVITTYVRPDKGKEYNDWAAKVQGAQAQFPGYRGSLLQPPTSAKQPYWTTLVRFATPEQLETWLNSPQRQELLREHEALVSSWTQRRMSSFGGWFPDEGAKSPSAQWKQSLIVILNLFPIVMLEMRFLGPVTRGLKPAVGTFIGNVISVFLLAWPLIPISIRGLRWWLEPAEDKGPMVHIGGTALIFAIYAAEIAFFWTWLT